MSKNNQIKDSMAAITILAGVLGEEVRIFLKSDETVWHRVTATNDKRCTNPTCVAHYTLHLVDGDGLALPGELDEKRMADYVPLEKCEIDRAFDNLQKSYIRTVALEVKEYIDDRLDSKYVPQVGDVVKVYDSVNSSHPTETIGFVAALLSDENAKEFAYVQQTWSRNDMVLITFHEGRVNFGCHNSRHFTKIGVASDYGLTAARLTELAASYSPLNGRYGKYRPESGRLAGLD